MDIGDESESTSRRSVLFDNLDDVLDECRRLLESGYRMNGSWTLGQICQHLRLTIESNIDGYPTWMTVVGFPLRPIVRKLMLPRLLAGNSPLGIPTASMFVPPSGLDDAREVEAFNECVARFRQEQNQLHPHPGFGRLSKSDFERFHAAHASHHLGFLSLEH